METPVSEVESDFVNISLNELPTEVSGATKQSSAALRATRRSRWWNSQLNVNSTKSTDDLSIPENIQPENRRNSFSGTVPDQATLNSRDASGGSSGSDDLCALSPVANRFDVHPKSTTDLHFPPRRKFEGRYRSRLERPKQTSYMLRTKSLFDNFESPGKCFDASLDPGMSMTVTDANGELYVVHSPIRRSCLLSRPSEVLNSTSGHHQGKSISSKPENVNEETKFDTKELSSKDGSPQKSGRPDLKPFVNKPSDNSNTMSFAGNAAIQSSAIESVEKLKSEHHNLTRMSHLPPKPRAEVKRHLADFTAMMQQSKRAEKKRQLMHESEKKKNEDNLVHVRRIWEEEVLPNWTRARQEAKYRELWWTGIPQVLRARLWPRACGNMLMLSHDIFSRALTQAKEAIHCNTFPVSLLEAVKADMDRTLPSLRLFAESTGPLRQDLADVLYAYIYVRADEASQRAGLDNVDLHALSQTYTLYLFGTANLAAMMLMNMPPEAALIMLLNLIAQKSWLKAMYRLDQRQADLPVLGYERVFNALLAERMPDIYANLHKAGVRPSDYVRDWIRTLFVPWLDVDTTARLWDIMYVWLELLTISLLDETESVLFRIALALVELLEPRLYVRDHDELVSILRGTNCGAIRVWRHSINVDDNSLEAPIDQIYVQYSIGEKQLFRKLREQELWWKDLTLRRLLDRELNR